MFGQQQAQPTGGSIFGNFKQPEQQQTGSSIFGSSTGQPPQRPTLNLFGQSTQPAGSAPTSIFDHGAPPSQPAAGSSIFGQAPQQSQPAAATTGSIFGQSAPKPSLFGAQPAAQTSNLFGQPAAKPAATNLFGASQPAAGAFSSSTQPAQQQNPGTTGLSLFSSLSGANQAPNQSTLGPTGLGQSQSAFAATLAASGYQHRPEKSILDQISALFQKWNPEDPSCAFQYYLYNTVDPAAAPYYAPHPSEDENKWEEALRKKPSPGAIPLLVRGPLALGRRLEQQAVAISYLQARLHELNTHLEATRQKHELEYSVRAQEARRRHTALSRRYLAMGAKLQLLRNRGYGLDPAEEQLRNKLMELEKLAFDPVVDGRQEEIWARMGVVRERAMLLQAEFEKLGKERKSTEAPIDEESMKKVEKLLVTYDNQLTQLKKEHDSVEKDFKDWHSTIQPGGTL